MAVAVRTLNDVPVGEGATVASIRGEGALRRRIMDMGITTGTKVEVRKVAPLGDPMEVTLRGFDLALRKAEAESIVVN